MSGAAFFDLDRTLLQGGTGPLLSKAMYDLGIVTRKLPAERLLFGIFDLLGENLPSIMLARQATLVARGRAADTFDEAAVAAAEVIASHVHPFAHALIEQHKAAGRPVVMATTTPHHLIAPLADALGFDHVIATRYSVNADGMFDGSLRGPFVWSRGKLLAVQRFAQRNNIDLAESYAYSDSIYDLPLLSAVGQPAAVNPDPRMAMYAAVRRWPIVHFDVAPGVFKVPVLGVELQNILKWAFHPQFQPFVRWEFHGMENLPKSGPVILAGNHRSYFDFWALAQLVRLGGRPIRMMAKRELFDLPVIGQIASAMGGISVDRGEDKVREPHNAQESFAMAQLALEGGEVVGVLPQATIPRGPAFFDPVLTGKTGAARLAAATRAPVIPFAIWGSEKVWPRSASMPNFLNLTDPPTVSISVGEPVELRYRSPAADTRRIMTAIADLLPEQARTRHTPTQEELRATYPGGQLP